MRMRSVFIVGCLSQSLSATPRLAAGASTSSSVPPTHDSVRSPKLILSTQDPKQPHLSSSRCDALRCSRPWLLAATQL